MNIKNLEIDKKYINNLKNNEIKSLNSMQSAVFYLVKENKNIYFNANTGSGKTLAYVLPLIEKINKGDKVLIVVPTKDLINQVIEVFKQNFNDIKVANINKDINNLENAQVLVSTPHKTIKNLSKFKFDILVLDEVDFMLSEDYAFKFVGILSRYEYKQVIACSATHSDSTLSKLEKIQRDIKSYTYKVEENKKFDYMLIPDKLKPFLLVNFLQNVEQDQQVLIFIKSKSRVDELFRYLRLKGVSVDKLHKDLQPRIREKILKNFKNKKFQFLLATDIIARGFDMRDLKLMINYDFNMDLVSLKHRSGRVGRFGRDSQVITLLTKAEFANHKEEIEKALNTTLSRYEYDYLYSRQKQARFKEEQKQEIWDFEDIQSELKKNRNNPNKDYE